MEAKFKNGEDVILDGKTAARVTEVLPVFQSGYLTVSLCAPEKANCYFYELDEPSLDIVIEGRLSKNIK